MINCVIYLPPDCLRLIAVMCRGDLLAFRLTCKLFNLACVAGVDVDVILPLMVASDDLPPFPFDGVRTILGNGHVAHRARVQLDSVLRNIVRTSCLRVIQLNGVCVDFLDVMPAFPNLEEIRGLLVPAHKLNSFILPPRLLRISFDIEGGGAQQDYIAAWRKFGVCKNLSVIHVHGGTRDASVSDSLTAIAHVELTTLVIDDIYGVIKPKTLATVMRQCPNVSTIEIPYQQVRLLKLLAKPLWRIITKLDVACNAMFDDATMEAITTLVMPCLTSLDITSTPVTIDGVLSLDGAEALLHFAAGSELIGQTDLATALAENYLGLTSLGMIYYDDVFHEYAVLDDDAWQTLCAELVPRLTEFAIRNVSVDDRMLSQLGRFGTQLIHVEIIGGIWVDFLDPSMIWTGSQLKWCPMEMEKSTMHTLICDLSEFALKSFSVATAGVDSDSDENIRVSDAKNAFIALVKTTAAARGIERLPDLCVQHSV